MKRVIILILFLLFLLNINANRYGLQRIEINLKNVYFSTYTLYDLITVENLFLGYRKNFNQWNINVKFGALYFAGGGLLKKYLGVDNISFNVNGIIFNFDAYMHFKKLQIGPSINYFNNFSESNIRLGLNINYLANDHFSFNNKIFYNISLKRLENIFFIKYKKNHLGIELGYYYPGFEIKNMITLKALPYLDIYYEK